MPDEQAPDATAEAPSATTAAAAAPSEEPEQDAHASPEGDADSEATSDDGEPDLVEEFEFDFGPTKKTWPKGTKIEDIAAELKDFTRSLYGDYTRKSQANAETSKELQAREVDVQRLSNMQGEILDAYSKGVSVRDELTELSQVDLNALWQSNPDQARRVSDLLAKKQSEFNRIVQEVSKKEAEAESHQTAAKTTRLEKGREIVEKAIPGFASRAAEVVDYAIKNYGVAKDDADNWPENPVAAIMAHKAMMYDKMTATANAKPQQPKPAQVEPVAAMKSTGGKNTKSFDLVKDADKMSSAEWLKMRNNQLRKKA